MQLNDGWGAADDGLAFGSVTLVQSLEALFYLVRDGYAGTYYFDTDPIRENPVRECEVNIARTKQLLADRPAVWWTTGSCPTPTPWPAPMPGGMPWCGDEDRSRPSTSAPTTARRSA